MRHWTSCRRNDIPRYALTGIQDTIHTEKQNTNNPQAFQAPFLMLAISTMTLLDCLSDEEVGAILRKLYHTSIGKEDNIRLEGLAAKLFDMLLDAAIPQDVKYAQKCEKAKRSAELRWQKRNIRQDANAMQTQCEGKAIKSNESKMNQVDRQINNQGHSEQRTSEERTDNQPPKSDIEKLREKIAFNKETVLSSLKGHSREVIEEEIAKDEALLHQLEGANRNIQ